MKKPVVGLLGSMLVLLVFYGNALAQETEGAFVTQSEDVRIENAGGSQSPLPAFAKVLAGAKLTLGDGGKLQMIYLASGRQELWNGPAVISIGTTQSLAQAPATAPTVKTLPAHLVRVLTRSGAVISDLKTRQGMVRVRSLLTARKVKAALRNYDEMRQQAAPDDITPEIYLLTALDELKAYTRMKQPLDEILTRQPNNAEAKKMHAQFIAILELETAK